MTTPTAELATITEYGPPYWDDRAWDPLRETDREPIPIPQRERRLFRALHTGDPYKVLRQLSALERRHADLAEPYGKTRAFAIDMP